MARSTLRFTTQRSSINDSYDRSLVLELLERIQLYLPSSERNNRILYHLTIVLDQIMGRVNRREDGTTDPIWNAHIRFGRNSNMGTFLANNFPKDHRIWGYVTVAGYAGRAN